MTENTPDKVDTRKLIREFAQELLTQGKDPTQSAIRSMIKQRVGINPSATTISSELAAMRRESNEKASLLVDLPDFPQEFMSDASAFLMGVITKAQNLAKDSLFEEKAQVQNQMEQANTKVSHAEALANKVKEEYASLQRYTDLLTRTNAEQKQQILQIQDAHFRRENELLEQIKQITEQNNRLSVEIQIVQNNLARSKDDLNQVVAECEARVQKAIAEKDAIEEKFKASQKSSIEQIESIKNFMMNQRYEEREAHKSKVEFMERSLTETENKYQFERQTNLALQGRAFELTSQISQRQTEMAALQRQYDELKQKTTSSFDLIVSWEEECRKQNIPASTIDKGRVVLQFAKESEHFDSILKQSALAFRMIEFAKALPRHIDLTLDAVIDGDLLLEELSLKVPDEDEDESED